ncbi:blood vessel epicardial substance-like [Varroa jacobsoni]|uniref:blood vessel epicardial substance-like n=1 Tax=Varroa jacobsoni TaxID=62625 RepID=UPI000BF8B689|nr:blood vessel epicardial substance-like [Varroa jacobsoni]
MEVYRGRIHHEGKNLKFAGPSGEANSCKRHPLATTMNETITILSEALSTMMSPLSPLGGGIGAAVAGNETGKVVPVPSSRACGAWNTGQHNLFQTAEVALILGSLVPHRFQMSTLGARGLFTVAFLLLTGWGTFVVCAWDITLWSLIHLFINGVYFSFLLWKNIPPPVDGDLRPLYEKSFQPLLVERRLFNKLIKHAVKLKLENGKRYSVEGITMADERVSILISGRLQVTCEGVLLHYIQPCEFVDSPEFESCPSGSEKTSQVTITAVESSVYLCWTREAFANALRQNEFLDNVVFNLIGKDIAQKLYSLNEFHRLGGSGMLVLRKEQADWWRSPIPRSVSVDAVNTEARGRVRSLCWAKDITQDNNSSPNQAMSDSYAQTRRFQDTILPQLKPLPRPVVTNPAAPRGPAAPSSGLIRQPSTRPGGKERGEEVEMKRVNFADKANIISNRC